jgi:hypothetical protein
MKPAFLENSPISQGSGTCHFRRVEQRRCKVSPELVLIFKITLCDRYHITTPPAPSTV